MFDDHRFCFAYIFLMKNDQANQVANNNPSSARFLAPIVLKFHHPRDRDLQKRGTVIFYKDVFGLPSRFRRTSDGALIPGPEQGSALVNFLRWLFFS